MLLSNFGDENRGLSPVAEAGLTLVPPEMNIEIFHVIAWKKREIMLYVASDH